MSLKNLPTKEIEKLLCKKLPEAFISEIKTLQIFVQFLKMFFSIQHAFFWLTAT